MLGRFVTNIEPILRRLKRGVTFITRIVLHSLTIPTIKATILALIVSVAAVQYDHFKHSFVGNERFLWLCAFVFFFIRYWLGEKLKGKHYLPVETAGIKEFLNNKISPVVTRSPNDSRECGWIFVWDFGRNLEKAPTVALERLEAYFLVEKKELITYEISERHVRFEIILKTDRAFSPPKNKDFKSVVKNISISADASDYKKNSFEHKCFVGLSKVSKWSFI